MSAKYDSLSDEAQETIKDMVSYCISHGKCMGMDEGINTEGNNEEFRTELEQFSDYNT